MEKIKENKKLVIAIITTGIFYLVFGLLQVKLASSNILIFDARLVYTPSLFYDTVSILKSNNSILYIIFRSLDTFFPFLYSYVLYKLLSNHSKSILNYLPILAIIFDLSENIIMIFLTYVLNTTNSIPVYILNMVTILKFTVILVIIIIIIYRLTGLTRFLNRSGE